MAATYHPIATQTLTTGVTTFSFTSIPNIYTDLRLIFIGTGSGSNIWLTFNNDSTALYSQTNLLGNSITVTSSTVANSTRITEVGNYVNVNSVLMTCDIFSYTASINKTLLKTLSGDRNGTGFVTRNVALYRSTTAINRINIIPSSGANFNNGTNVTLYGIKAV